MFDFSNGPIRQLPIHTKRLGLSKYLKPTTKNVVIPVTLVLFYLLIVEDIVQDTTVQIKGSWRFLNSVHLYINKKKNNLTTALPLMLPQFGMICLMRSALPQLLPVSEKG